jgi:hypothetical protein
MKTALLGKHLLMLYGMEVTLLLGSHWVLVKRHWERGVKRGGFLKCNNVGVPAIMGGKNRGRTLCFYVWGPSELCSLTVWYKLG